MIYDFYKDVGYIAIAIYSVLFILLMSITVWQVVITIKTLIQYRFEKVNIKLFTLFVHIAIISVTSILSIFFAVNLSKVYKMYYLYHSDKCSIVTGNIDQINSKRNDYRDEEQYDVSFDVRNIHFPDNNNIICSKELLDKLKELEGKEVTVFYTKTDSDYFIHAIKKGGGS